MLDNYCEKLAKLAVSYSLNVKKGDRILLKGPVVAQELLLALYAEIIKAGGHPLLMPDLEGAQEIFFKYAADYQLEYYDDIFLKMVKEFNGLVQIFADYNTKRLELIDSKKLGKMQGSAKRFEFQKIMGERESKGELNWVIIPYPCHSYAQEANMDLFSYTDFVAKALLLEKEDPIQEWKALNKKQENLVKFLNKIKVITIIGEDTNLTLSIEGRLWENCSGQNNLPDGEVCTSPIEDSVSGHIRFTYPGIYNGKEVENIYLEFKDGKVIKGTAEKGQELLQEILKIKNADILGEFAIGTNYGITHFSKNMLFDEKIGGTIHCALGLGLPKAGSKNISAIHWDILKDMRLPGSKILADGKLIYEEGKWKI
ncbi:MAG: aminopeptidase [Candidatus Hermodarchaeota archaeon]